MTTRALLLGAALSLACAAAAPAADLPRREVGQAGRKGYQPPGVRWQRRVDAGEDREAHAPCPLPPEARFYVSGHKRNRRVEQVGGVFHCDRAGEGLSTKVMLRSPESQFRTYVNLSIPPKIFILKFSVAAIRYV